jgi:hypothetical protein
MRKFILLTAALVLVPQMAQAVPVTFDFTGVVTYVTGLDPATGLTGTLYSSVPIGATVTGTYTIDFGNAVSFESSGTPGVGSNWNADAFGGSGYSIPIPSGLVFYSTAQVLGTDVSYATAPVGTGTYDTYSSIDPNVNGNTNVYRVGETALTSVGSMGPNGTESQFQLEGGAGPVFDSQGLPVLSSSAENPFGVFGTFVNGTRNDVEFTITSLVPAPIPIPASAWLLISGLGGLGIFGRTRMAAQR